MSHILYGSETDGPYIVEVPDAEAETYAANVNGTVHDSADDALSAWESRDGEPVPPAPVSDAPAPSGVAPADELGSGDPAPENGAQGATFGQTQTPTESSPSADQR